MSDKSCSIEECSKPHYAKGWCQMHYARNQRTGTPTPTAADKKRPGPAPDPTRPRSRSNPNNPSRSRPRKEKVQRTHCKHGHELTPENVRYNTKGAMYCAVCAAEASQRHRRSVDPDYGTRRDRYVPERLAVEDATCKNGHVVTAETVVTGKNGRRRCPVCYTQSQRKARLNKYSLSPEEYEDMLERQDGKCAVCKEVMGGSRNEHVDHDHVTGKVRGLLCAHCNTAIGKFRDEPERLIAAAQYLMNSW